MLGYVEHREVQIWLEVAQNVQKVDIKYKEVGKIATQQVSVDKTKLGHTYNPVKLTLEGLAMNTAYEYQVWLDGEMQKFDFPLAFHTRKLW